MNNKGKIAVLILVLLVSVFAISFGFAGKARSQAACNDKSDNDGDGYIDYPNDPGCSSRSDTNENNCGDNAINGNEVCDGNSQSCTTSGGYSGTQSCNTQCNGWNSCTSAQYCGDGIKNGNEVCDGSSLGGQTCSSQGFSGGTLSCNSQCSGFVTSGCYTNSCSDSDGYNVFAQGTVTGYLSGNPFSYTDSCVGNSTTVTENYCNGNQAGSYTWDCASNTTTTCFNGACI